jgi:hypothetical protein
MVLRAIVFREAISKMDSKGDEQDEADEDEESDGEPSATRMRRTQPGADINDAKTVCLKALEDVDDI